MEQLLIKIQAIMKKKLDKLEVTSPDSVYYPILEDEIEDAASIWILLRSINSKNREDKIKEIKSIVGQTTSGSIYELLKEVK